MPARRPSSTSRSNQPFEALLSSPARLPAGNKAREAARTPRARSGLPAGNQRSPRAASKGQANGSQQALTADTRGDSAWPSRQLPTASS